LWKKGSLNLDTGEIVIFLQVSDVVSVVSIPRKRVSTCKSHRNWSKIAPAQPGPLNLFKAQRRPTEVVGSPGML
jgi:hypothetical protein